MIKKFKNLQKLSNNGFAHMFFLLLVIVIIIVGIVAVRIYSNQTQFSSTKPKYKITDGNYSTYLDVIGDKTYIQQASLTVIFDDSATSNDGSCPYTVDGFLGDASITYKNNTEAVIIASQNVKPKNDKHSDTVTSYVECNMSENIGYSKKISLDSKWIRSQAKHTVKLGNHTYDLTYDKQNFLVKFIKPDVLNMSWFYPPGKIVLLFSHRDTGYSTCMSEAELKAYAKSHGLSLVQETNSDIYSSYRQFKGGANDGNYYTPNILVNANDSLDSVFEAQKKNSPFDQCNVKASTNLTVSQN
jgi:hypothetical protein